MSESISRIDNKSVQADLSAASKAVVTPNPVSVPAAAGKAAEKEQAAKPSSIVDLGKANTDLGLYATNVTNVASAPAPTRTENTGTGNSDGSYTAGKDSISLSIEKSDSGYDNKIYYSTDNFATRHLVGIDNHTGTVDIGSFKPGTRIDFGIDNGQGSFFRTGAASANSDNFKHAQSSVTADGNHQVGFEDLRGGGDRDFNDAILTVRTSRPTPAPPPASAGKNPEPIKAAPVQANPGKPVSPTPLPVVPAQGAKPPLATTATPATPAAPAKQPAAVTPPVAAKPPAAPPVASLPAKPPVVVSPPVPSPVATKPSDTKDNRSGLGDGTNPGQGAGRVNSPNTGTLNPAAANKAAVVTPVVAKPATAAVQASKTSPVVVPAVSSSSPAKTTASSNGASNTSSSALSSVGTAATVNKASQVAQASVSGTTVDKKVESALKAYQIPATQKSTTSVFA